MSYKETRITFRSDINVPFWNWPDEVKEYIEEVYVVTGLRENIEKIISEDGFVRTYTGTWKNEVAFSTFCKDPVIIACIIDRNKYNEANDILSFWQKQ
jgi:hypothetical protein